MARLLSPTEWETFEERKARDDQRFNDLVQVDISRWEEEDKAEETAFRQRAQVDVDFWEQERQGEIAAQEREEEEQRRFQEMAQADVDFWEEERQGEIAEEARWQESEDQKFQEMAQADMAEEPDYTTDWMGANQLEGTGLDYGQGPNILEQMGLSTATGVGGTKPQPPIEPGGGLGRDIGRLMDVLGAPAEAVTEYGIPAVATPLRMATKLETPREAFSRAQGRVEEMHPAQRIVTELVLDPLNWVPGVGFTKTEDVMQVLRSAKRGIEEVAPAARRLATEGETGFLKLGGGKEASRIAELQKERMALAAERRELQTSIQNVPGQETPANIARNDELTARLYELDTQIRQAGERGSLSIPGGERPIEELPLFKGEEPLGIPPNMPTVKLTPREGLILNAQTGQPIEVTAWRASPDTPPKELQPRLARSYALDRSMAQPEGALGQAPYHVEEKVVRLENPLVVEGLQGDLLDLWASRGDIVAKGLADESAKLGRPPMGWYRRADNYIAEKAADLGHDGILYKAGYRSEVVELRPLAGVSPRAAPEPPKGLTPEAEALLRKVDEGGVPLYTTDPLERIARENGVDPSGKAPNQIIDELRQRAGGPAEPPAGALGQSAEPFPSAGSPTIGGMLPEELPTISRGMPPGGRAPPTGGVPPGVGGVGKPPPKAPPPKPLEPSEPLAKIRPGETATELLQDYEGRTGVAALRIRQENEKGYRLLRQVGEGRVIENPGVASKDMDALYRALHGEGDAPERLRPIYDDLKARVAVETKATQEFDPKFMPHPDYFPRGWRAPRETELGPKRVGATPGFKKPRIDATYSEMVAEGWKPITNNPYDMIALREIAGAEYREQTVLIKKLKELGEAVAVDGPVPEGWRIPRIGPAFEGKPFATKKRQVLYTPRFAVKDKIAGRLENMFGTRADWGTLGPVSVHKWVMASGNAFKRVKLTGSVFQQMDFAARSGFAAFGGAVEDLLAGRPISAANKVVKLPATLGKMAWANVSPARRTAIREQILSGKPILAERPDFSLRSVAEAGWKQEDISMLGRDLKAVIKEAAVPTPGWTGPARAVGRRVNQLNQAVQNGLFEGVYPEAQIAALKNLIGPRLARMHPEWSNLELSRNAANEVNKMFSALGNYQTILGSSRNLKDFAHALIFSTNESEALIKQAISAIGGKNAGLWREFYLGGALFLAMVANGVHFAATGEPLPFNRYSPVRLRRGRPEYNPQFMAPQLPGVKGRGGGPVDVDLVMQMDTVLRLLDPMAYWKARENVLPRALDNQYVGKDFFGRELKGPEDRLSQLVADLALPIPAQQAAGILRETVSGARQVIPEGESRLGATGLGLQMTGLNLRAETTRDLLDRSASESYGGKSRPSGGIYPQDVRWDELEPRSQNELKKQSLLADELKRRGETAVERGGTQGYGRLEEVDTRRLEAENQAVASFQQTGDAREFRDAVSAIQRQVAIEKAQVNRDFQLFKQARKMPKEPGKKALVEYYALFDSMRLPGARLDFDSLDREMAALEASWTPEQRAYVKVNTGMTEHVPLVQELTDARKLLRQLDDIPHYQGLNIEQGAMVDDFVEQVNQERERRTAQGNVMPEALIARELAGDRVGLLQWFRILQSAAGRSRFTNPEYDRFLTEHHEEISPFYPSYYGAMFQSRLRRDQAAGGR